MTATVAPFLDAHGVMMSPATGGGIDSLNASEVARVFMEHSLVLFRGFDVSTAAFKAFTDRLCEDFITYEGGASARRAIGGDPTVMTVTEPQQTFAIPLHGEMYYVKRPPEVLWFFCVRPAAAGGETTVADGAVFYERLSDRARDLFEAHRVRYICTYPDGRWQALFQTADPDAVRRFCEANDTTFRWDARDRSVVTEYEATACRNSRYGFRRAFINNVLTMTWWERHGVRSRIVRLDDGAAIPDEVLDELREIEAAITMPVSWQPQDIVMVDNTRYMHGRRAFADSGREIYVRLSQCLRVL
jgi:alpha-ketoglutarate-dependent taurine dioxygenase